MVPHGIDPGFAYNPGQAWQQGLPPPAAPSAPMRPATPVPTRIPPAEAVAPKAPAEPGPVGPLQDAARRAIGAQAVPVELSKDTLAKQLRRHPELPSGVYAEALPALLAEPQLVLQQTDRKAILLRETPAGLLAAFVKRTGDASALYLVSLRRADAKDLRRLLRLYRVIFGSVEALRRERDGGTPSSTLDGSWDGAPEGPPRNPS